MIIVDKYLNADFYEIEKDWSFTPDPPAQDLVKSKIDIRENRDGIVLNKDSGDDYYQDSPFIDYVFNLMTKNISSLSFIKVVPGSTDIKGQVIIDGQPKKWVAAWTDTTLAVANANDLSDIETNISALFDGIIVKDYKLRIYLISTVPAATPELILINYTVPDLFSKVSQLRSNLTDVNEHVFSDLKVYNAIVEADEAIKMDLDTYIDFDSLTTITTRISNKLSQLKTAIIVLQRLFKTPKDVKEINMLTMLLAKYDKIIKAIKDGSIELSAGSVTIDSTRQGKAFGFGSEGQRLEFDSKQDEDEFLIDYDWFNDGG